MTSSILVFTDLDGTLLDHSNYDFAAAQPALDALQERAIGLVLCSSKTASEILQMRQKPVFRNCMAIVENGAGILHPDSEQAEPSPTHADLMQRVDSLPQELRAGFSGFSSWSLETLQAQTGLDEASAERAAERDYSEPGIWRGDASQQQRFIDALRNLDIEAQQGGRFLTLGFAANKADRMREIINERQASSTTPITSIALGDAPNDINMLQQADFGIIVPNPAHGGIPILAGEERGRIRRAQTPGSQGWNDSLLALINDPDFPAKELTNG